MKLKAKLKNWSAVPAVEIPFSVTVLPCTPLTLAPKSKPKAILLEMKEGDDGE
jgi:hypothetical protein